MEATLNKLKPSVRRWAEISPALLSRDGDSPLGAGEAQKAARRLEEFRDDLGCDVVYGAPGNLLGLVYLSGWKLDPRDISEVFHWSANTLVFSDTGFSFSTLDQHCGGSTWGIRVLGMCATKRPLILASSNMRNDH